MYRSCSELLSKQMHYDFGMRALKQILTLAGQLIRKHPNEDEEKIMVKAIIQSNTPKFFHQDVVIFQQLIQDIFPSTKTDLSSDARLKFLLTQKMKENHFQANKNQIEKMVQLHETTLNRTGVMLLGEAGTSKTVVFSNLRAVINGLECNLKEDPLQKQPSLEAEEKKLEEERLSPIGSSKRKRRSSQISQEDA